MHLNKMNYLIFVEGVRSMVGLGTVEEKGEVEKEV